MAILENVRQFATLMRSSSDMNAVAQSLVDTANANGGEDKIGIVLARLEGN